MSNTPTYAEVTANFRPQFGNANHIAAARMIPRVAELQHRINQCSAGNRKVPKPVLKEIEALEKRVVDLLKPDAKQSTYPPSYPQNL